MIVEDHRQEQEQLWEWGQEWGRGEKEHEVDERPREKQELKGWQEELEEQLKKIKKKQSWLVGLGQ